MTARRFLSSPVLAVALMLFAAIPSLPVAADTLQDAARLLRQKQNVQALEQVDKFLSGNPKDAQGRFLKGVILTEMNRTPDAVAIFTKLTQDYPELPEPYNNLAVIYAQQKQYDKARQSLEMAIRTHPSYATAHENLGDIYSRMASQAYDKALQLDSSNSTAQTKLSMIRDLMSVASRNTRVASPAPTTVAAAEPARPAAPVIAAVQPKPKRMIAPAADEPKAPPVEPKVAPVARAADTDEIARQVEAWASAWAAKDFKAYLASYAANFETPAGASRAQWETERRSRIVRPGVIQVAIENLKITAESTDRASARFRQHYRSGSFKSSANKTLTMIRQEGKWRIQQERIGN